MAQFSPVECEQKWHGPLPALAHKKSPHLLLCSFPLIWLIVGNNEVFRHEKGTDERNPQMGGNLLHQPEHPVRNFHEEDGLPGIFYLGLLP